MSELPKKTEELELNDELQEPKVVQRADVVRDRAEWLIQLRREDHGARRFLVEHRPVRI